MAEVLGHAPYALLAIAFAACAAIAISAGSLLRRAIGVLGVAVMAAALVSTLTTGFGAGDRAAAPVLAAGAAAAILAIALAIRAREAYATSDVAEIAARDAADDAADDAKRRAE